VFIEQSAHRHPNGGAACYLVNRESASAFSGPQRAGADSSARGTDPRGRPRRGSPRAQASTHQRDCGSVISTRSFVFNSGGQ
jgi:hypothetical protein